MKFRNSKATFSLKCPSGKRETEAFHWIRKESEVAKYVTRLDFTYQDGFIVTFVVPFDWHAGELDNVVERTCLQFTNKFIVIKE
jgi:hypothetical protein